MSNEIIYIFGDSYAEVTQFNHYYWEYSWPRKLATQFNVKNYAAGGTGPQDVCAKLHDIVTFSNKSKLADSSAIIVLPDISRYNFSFYQSSADHVLGQITSSTDKFFTDEYLKKYNIDTIEFILNFRKYYLEHSINWLIEEARYLSYFDNIAQYFKKTLVLPVNPLMSNYQYSNIDIAPIDLESIAKHEKNINIIRGLDSRLNHLSLDNHNIMLEQLCNWIINKTPIENKFIIE